MCYGSLVKESDALCFVQRKRFDEVPRVMIMIRQRNRESLPSQTYLVPAHYFNYRKTTNTILVFMYEVKLYSVHL
jgi:hypothetical protein